MAKKISFIGILKLILALIPIGIKLYKLITEEKDEEEKSKYLEALRSGDVDTLHKLLGDLSAADNADPDRGSEDSPDVAERKL